MIDRFREIISDPVNLLIDRVSTAGFVDNNNFVTLHNGIKVPLSGRFAYYNNFADILILNRGVHEPLEEYCFQQTLKKINSIKPIMIELGAYWGHYSMWFKKKYMNSRVILVEPHKINLNSGKNNFSNNELQGEFINSLVGLSSFRIDDFLSNQKITSVDILHSDIQGFELEMLEGAHYSFKNNAIKYLFISTHSQYLHTSVLDYLSKYNYRIEVSSAYDFHTTSYDGFILASSIELAPVFTGFTPLGRIDICKSTPLELINSIYQQLSM